MDRATAPARSGITQTTDGSAYIPSSTRADGSMRKEIRVRPGYVPPEDIETYKNQRADAFKNRVKGGIPGAEGLQNSIIITDGKSKNAKRREAAKRKQEQPSGDDLADALRTHDLGEAPEDKLKADWRDPAKLQTSLSQNEADEVERQKKIRNLLKKLKAVRELKAKKAAGDRLSIDQIAKMGKEPELVRDLQKLKYEGPEMTEGGAVNGESTSDNAEVDG